MLIIDRRYLHFDPICRGSQHWSQGSAELPTKLQKIPPQLVHNLIWTSISIPFNFTRRRELWFDRNREIDSKSNELKKWISISDSLGICHVLTSMRNAAINP